MTHTVVKCLSGIVLLSAALLAQQDPAIAAPADSKAPEATEPVKPAAGTPIDKRAYGVLPNYRTADGTVAFEPISRKRKMSIGIKDSFDYPVYFTSVVFSGISHLQNSSPQFGQGTLGFAKRYSASYADLSMGNIFSESLFPIALKQDPRYFRVGDAYGGRWKRVGYALTRVLVCKTDTGKNAFNYSEILGNASAVAVSNVYYSDNRTAGGNIQKLGIQVGTDALSNILKEFWPDIKKSRLAKKNKSN